MFEKTVDMNDLTTWLRPSPNVHVGTFHRFSHVRLGNEQLTMRARKDQSDRAVVHRIQLRFPEFMDYLLQGRVRIVKYAPPNLTWIAVLG